MRITRAISGAAGVILFAAMPAVAGNVLNYYPVHSAHNFCPAGLQPVTANGVICCGTPNQSVSYSSVMAHAPQRAHRPRSQTADCPIGEKGCR